MIFDNRYNLVHAEGYRPMLYDLQNDPEEISDLGDDENHQRTAIELMDRLNEWYRQHHNKIMHSDAEMIQRENGDLRRGIFLGIWDQADDDGTRRTGRTDLTPYAKIQ